MDTREKIQPLNGLHALLQTGEWVIAVGQFDPLTAVQAKRLSALRTPGSKLLAIILETGHTLLPGKARAALIAALREVDAVAVAEQEAWRVSIPADSHIRVVEETEAEQERSAEFVRLVVARQGSSNGGRSQ